MIRQKNHTFEKKKPHPTNSSAHFNPSVIFLDYWEKGLFLRTFFR